MRPDPAAAGTDPVAVVTGAATGIGLATLIRLRADGVNTFGIVRAKDDIPSGLNGPQWIVADVRDRAAVADAFAEIADRAGQLDIVVSNAGIARHGQLPDLQDADVEVVVATNLFGFLNVLAASIPLLRQSGGGAVVAVSSVHAVATAPQVTVYAASKAAIVGAVRAAALDHGPDGIRVNAVLPGSVDTPMLRASAQLRAPDDPDRAIRQWGGNHPIGRVLTADEVANAIVFLAGPQASGITGVALPVDGGLLAKLAL